MEDIGKHAVIASRASALLTEDEKNHALKVIAEMLVVKTSEILEENSRDVQNAIDSGVSEALCDRLLLTPSRIQGISDGLKMLRGLPDPIGEVIETLTPSNGLIIDTVRVPLGVIGIIYESRPNVTIDAFGLCFKSGNSVVLKGGKEAIYTNIVLVNIVRQCLSTLGMDPNMIQLITATDRSTTHEMMRMNEYIDVLIPRGSAGLIRAVVENSTIPVIETGSGNCHIYVDAEANLEMALDIIENAKCQRLGVCNACESLVVHESIAPQFIPLLVHRLSDVRIHGDLTSQSFSTRILSATEEDYGKEYLDMDISLCVVENIDQAIQHINFYNTKHSEAIITNNNINAERFVREVDASTVYINASTRFTDGSEFGFGAEIGISTQKLHARGPMGLKQLTSIKYIAKGKGQIRI